jgi:hypothetical protein
MLENGRSNATSKLWQICNKLQRVKFLLQAVSTVTFSIYLIIPGALGPRVYSASNRNEYQKQKNNVSGSIALPVLRADNFATICVPIV